MPTESKQLTALTFCASTVPSIMLLAHIGWFWAGIAVVIAAILFSLANLRPKPQSPVYLLPVLLWNLLVLGAASDLLCDAFPDSNHIIGLLLLLFASFAAGRGRHIVLRVGAILLFLLIILYSMLLGFSLPGLEKEQLEAPLEIKWTFLASALTPMLFHFLRENGKKRAPFWLLGTLVMSILAALVSSGQPDFYTAMKSVSILGAMERLEPLVSVALTVGGFCLLGLICAVNEEVISQLFPTKKNLSMPINFFVGGVCIWVSGMLNGAVLAIGTAIFWGLLPILPQPLENQKKFEKKQKNA